jgi:hypothetical protein
MSETYQDYENTPVSGGCQFGHQFIMTPREIRERGCPGCQQEQQRQQQQLGWLVPAIKKAVKEAIKEAFVEMKP